MEEQQSQPTRLVSNKQVREVLTGICGEWSAKLLLYQLKSKYGIDLSENRPPSSLQSLQKALTETLGEGLSDSIAKKLYPETRHATGISKIDL